MSAGTEMDIGGDMLASSVEDAGVVGKFQVKSKRSAEINDVWTNVDKALEALKSPEGVLRLNRNAGIIYMADTPLRIATMVNFLDSLAESLHRQVFIEARIMEVKLDDTHKYGIDWTAMDVLFTSDAGIFPDAFDLLVNSGSTVALANTSSFSAVVDFLRTQGEVSVLSNPHLAVLNGQSAVFTVGFQFPFGDIEGVDENLETNTVTFRSTIKRAILGLQLGLTPQISKDGIISLLIVPTITRIKDEVDVELPTSRGGSQTISNPVIDLQELATTVRVRERQSVVLAGLINQIKKLDHEGLPLLSKIPFLKYFFGRFEETYENSELVIFLTPYLKTVH
jgi:MSHA biogenesis protein MshL